MRHRKKKRGAPQTSLKPPLDQDDAETWEQLNQQLVHFYEAGQYEQALPLALQVCDVARTMFGERHPESATSFENLAMLYQAMSKYAEAVPLLQEALAIRRQVLGEHDPETIRSLITLAMLYKTMGHYAEAEPLYRQALAISRQTLGEHHPTTATSLNNLAALYWAMGSYAKAEPLYQQALAIYRRTLGEQHLTTASCLNNLAALYYAMGNYTGAEPLYRQALAIYRQLLGEQDPTTATGLNNLAALYFTLGNYDQAEPLYRQALAITRQTVGEQHPTTATSLNNLAELYQAMGQYEQAEPFYRQALSIYRKTLGEEHPATAIGLDSLAMLYKVMGRYAEAEPLLQQALGLLRKTLGEQHRETADAMNDLAMLYEAMGKYEQAEPLLQQALAVYRQVLGEEHADTATGLNNLAGLYQVMGKYALAEPLYQQALTIRRRMLGEQHPDTAIGLNNLAELYQAMGNYTQAESCYQQALAIRHKAFGEQHPDTAESLNTLGELYMAMGNYAQAEPMLQHGLAIRRQVLGEQHRETARSLSDLALLYQILGKYADAAPLLQQGLAIRRQVLGEQHPETAVSLNNLAVLNQAMGNYAEAERLYQQALTIYRQALGEQHPETARSLTNLAILYTAMGRTGEAWMLLQQAVAITDHMLGMIFSISSERERQMYLTMLQGERDVVLSLVVKAFGHDRGAVQAALDLVLRRKGIGAEALAVQRDAVLSGRYPALQPQLEVWRALRVQLAEQTLAGPGAEGPATHRQQLERLESAKEQVETELAHQIPELNLEQRLRAANGQAIAAALPGGSVLVEFIRFNAYNFAVIETRGEQRWNPARYLALVVPAGASEAVQMIDLGAAADIDRLIAQVRWQLSGDVMNGDTRHMRPGRLPEEGVARAASFLSRQLVAPLAESLHGCTHVFLAPDGDLARLPFEVLPVEEGQRIIDMYAISYLSVGRDILRLNASGPGHSEAPLVLAAPNFDLAWVQPDPERASRRERPHRSRDLDSQAIHFDPLPGTQGEGKQIGALLQVPPQLGDQAVEGQLRPGHSPAILHLATHGFFLPNQQADWNQMLETAGGGSQASRIGLRLIGPGMENPMMRSGLALAGANTWLRGGTLPPEAGDAILTAEEVAGLDLLDTELVVLSACETGLGENLTGEGVFGLRRAFMLAGVKTLVMSLWKVPDRQTQELMVEFYRQLLAGQGRAEALRAAQLTMKAKYSNPYYWGAFICQGDPGPLKNYTSKQ